VRCSIALRVVDVMPTTSTVDEEDVSGVSTGGCTVSGSAPVASASRSASDWRAPVDVHALRQYGGHHRQTLNRLRAHDGDALHAVDRVLQRLGDEQLDLLRGKPRRLGLDGDLRGRELGKHVERRTGEGRDADDDHGEGEPEHHAAVPDRAANQPAQHARTSTLTRPTRRPR
jgi:hypothetical protein